MKPCESACNFIIIVPLPNNLFGWTLEPLCHSSSNVDGLCLIAFTGVEVYGGPYRLMKRNTSDLARHTVNCS